MWPRMQAFGLDGERVRRHARASWRAGRWSRRSRAGPSRASCSARGAGRAAARARDETDTLTAIAAARRPAGGPHLRRARRSTHERVRRRVPDVRMRGNTARARDRRGGHRQTQLTCSRPGVRGVALSTGEITNGPAPGDDPRRGARPGAASPAASPTCYQHRRAEGASTTRSSRPCRGATHAASAASPCARSRRRTIRSTRASWASRRKSAATPRRLTNFDQLRTQACGSRSWRPPRPPTTRLRAAGPARAHTPAPAGRGVSARRACRASGTPTRRASTTTVLPRRRRVRSSPGRQGRHLHARAPAMQRRLGR